MIIAASLAVGKRAIDAASAKPTPVEVWSGGDDRLTLQFRDALESAFASSPNFTSSSGKTQGTLVVTIPTHIAWKRIGRRIQVLYRAEFAWTGEQSIVRFRRACESICDPVSPGDRSRQNPADGVAAR